MQDIVECRNMKIEFSLKISLNSLLRTLSLKKRYKSCRYWLLTVPGRSLNLFIVSTFDFSANSANLLFVQLAQHHILLRLWQLMDREKERVLIAVTEKSRLKN